VTATGNDHGGIHSERALTPSADGVSASESPDTPEPGSSIRPETTSRLLPIVAVLGAILLVVVLLIVVRRLRQAASFGAGYGS
jgi:hypothetical protein